MKRVLILLLIVLMVLNGCAYSDPEPSTVPPTAEPTQAADVPTTVTTDPPTEPATEPTEPPTEETELPIEQLPGEVFRCSDIDNFHDVYVYPYTQEDIDSALRVIWEQVKETKAAEEVLEYELHWVAFDPVEMYLLTVLYDPYVERYSYDSMEAYYQNTLFFAGRETAHYDGTLTPVSSCDNAETTWILCRESPNAPWELYPGYSMPRFQTDDYYILQPDEISALNLTNERVLAGYFVSTEALFYIDVIQDIDCPVPYEQDTYILYVIDEETNTVVCREYPAE